MKHIIYIAMALLTCTLASCGDDEPRSNFTREFTMVYPKLASTHKTIAKLEKRYDNGGVTTATASYDGSNHLTKVYVKTVDKYGSTINEETIRFDYGNGAIICDKKIQDVTYAFEVNSQGAITSLRNVGTGQNTATLRYNGDNRLEEAQEYYTTGGSSVTTYKFSGLNVTQWKEVNSNATDSVGYQYSGAAHLNPGEISLPADNAFVFSEMVCAIMRNAGLFGALGSQLPTAIAVGVDVNNVDDKTGHIGQKLYGVNYDLDANGYVNSYSTTEVLKYTLKFSYK